MHENAIKIVWGVKNWAPFTKKNGDFLGKNFVHLFVRFLAVFGQIRCTFEFRIIGHSDKNKKAEFNFQR